MCVCVCLCMCVGGGAFCVYVGRVVRVFFFFFFFFFFGGGGDGEHLKFDRHLLYINEFEVENLCLSG